MSFKFEKGQLVEIIWSKEGKAVGDRFIIGNSMFSYTELSLDQEKNIYETGEKEKNTGRSYWAHESHLKLVNPDNDENSEFTFEELALNLKQGVVV